MRRPRDKTGVLLMAYGAAASLEEIPAYLKDILGGRPVPENLVYDVTERYRRIGGRSPLLDITRAQARALQEALGSGFEVFVGMRHSEPSIRSAVEAVSRSGCGSVVALPLTPYQSRMSVGAYLDALRSAVADTGAAFRVLPAGAWHDHPRLIQAFAVKARAALERVPAGLRPGTAMILSAHSLPARVVTEGDPYPGQLQATAEAVARAAGAADWTFAYQSRGASSREAWLGPDVSEAIRDLAARGVKALVLAPIGFVSDHLETLYDDDVLYRGQAHSLGLHFERAQALNSDPAFIAALVDVVVSSVRA